MSKTIGLIERAGIYNDELTASQIREVPANYKNKKTICIVDYYGCPNYLAGILGALPDNTIIATESESVYNDYANTVLNILDENDMKRLKFKKKEYNQTMNIIADTAIAISNKPYNEKGQGKNPIWFKLLENLNTPNVLRWQADVLPTSVLRSTQPGVMNARKLMYEKYGLYMVKPVRFGAFKNEGVGAIVDVCQTFCKRDYNGLINVKFENGDSYDFNFLNYGGRIVTPPNKEQAQFILEQTRKQTYKWSNKSKPTGTGIELNDLKHRIRQINSLLRKGKDKNDDSLSASQISALKQEKTKKEEKQEKLNKELFSKTKTTEYKYPYVQTFKKGKDIYSSEIVYTRELLDANTNGTRLGIPYLKTGYANGNFSIGAIQVIPPGFQTHSSVFQFPLFGRDAEKNGQKHKFYLDSSTIKFILQHWSYTNSNDNTQFDAIPVLDNFNIENDTDIVRFLNGNREILDSINKYWHG